MKKPDQVQASIITWIICVWWLDVKVSLEPYWVKQSANLKKAKPSSDGSPICVYSTAGLQALVLSWRVKDVRPFCLTCTWASDKKTGDLQCGFTRCWQKFLPPVMPGCATNQVTENELKDPPKRRGGYFWLDQWSHLPCSPTGSCACRQGGSVLQSRAGCEQLGSETF